MLPYQLLRTAAESEVKGEPRRVRQHPRLLTSGGGCATGAGELLARAAGGYQWHAAGILRQSAVAGAFSASILLRTAMKEHQGNKLRMDFEIRSR